MCIADKTKKYMKIAVACAAWPAEGREEHNKPETDRTFISIEPDFYARAQRDD